MARARSPKREEAFELYKASGGKKPLKDIAAELGLEDTQIRKWKCQDKWDDKLNGTQKVTLPKKKKKVKSNVTNENSLPKKNVGRPKAFNVAEELYDKIQHYFNSITRTCPAYDMVFDYKDEVGKDVFKQVPRLNNAGEQVHITEYFERPSVLGLCAHIGITRETLLQYEKDEEFSDAIKKAKSKIEQYLEEQLYRKDQVTGIIFNLKNNFGWKDKQEINHGGQSDSPIQIIMTPASKKYGVEK